MGSSLATADYVRVDIPSFTSRHRVHGRCGCRREPLGAKQMVSPRVAEPTSRIAALMDVLANREAERAVIVVSRPGGVKVLA